MRTYEISDAHDLALLGVACRALDRLRTAERLLKIDGLVTLDRWGQKHPHPAAGIARESAQLFVKAIRELGITTTPAGPNGRPPGS